MGLETLPEGELRSLPETIGKELSELKADVADAAIKSNKQEDKAALEGVKAALDTKGATRKSVIDSIQAGLKAMTETDLTERLSQMKGKLEAVRIGYEPALDTAANIGTAAKDGSVYAFNKSMELGGQGVAEFNKMPLVMKIPVLSSIIGGSAFALSWLRMRLGGWSSPNLDRIAMLAGFAGTVGTAGAMIYDANTKKATSAEAPSGDSAGTKTEAK